MFQIKPFIRVKICQRGTLTCNSQTMETTQTSIDNWLDKSIVVSIKYLHTVKNVKLLIHSNLDVNRYIEEKKSDSKKDILYEIKKQTKLINGDRSQNNGYILVVFRQGRGTKMPSVVLECSISWFLWWLLGFILTKKYMHLRLMHFVACYIPRWGVEGGEGNLPQKSARLSCHIVLKWPRLTLCKWLEALLTKSIEIESTKKYLDPVWKEIKHE